jgi:hypothetical protein
MRPQVSPKQHYSAGDGHGNLIETGGQGRANYVVSHSEFSPLAREQRSAISFGTFLSSQGAFLQNQKSHRLMPRVASFAISKNAVQFPREAWDRITVEILERAGAVYAEIPEDDAEEWEEIGE